MWPDGRCQEVLGIVWAEHHFVTSEVVLDELSEKFAEKFKLPIETIAAIDTELRFYQIEPRPKAPYDLQMGDPAAGS